MAEVGLKIIVLLSFANGSTTLMLSCVTVAKPQGNKSVMNQILIPPLKISLIFDLEKNAISRMLIFSLEKLNKVHPIVNS